MFGHSDDKKDDHQPIQDLLNEPALKGVLDSSEHHDEFNPALPPTDNQPQPASSDGTAPAGPPTTSNNDDLNDLNLDTSALDDASPEPPLSSAPVAPTLEAPREEHDTAPAPVVAPAAGSDDLLDIKQKALTQLSPLVDQLEQTPEEKFHTTMMMIQANDNQDLIKVAYEAAQAITDEKVKAKALLDIVNEINYFTQHSA